MRPAQLTPENLRALPRSEVALRDFNEAGAINAGKRIGKFRINWDNWNFNEAGAINAGKPDGRMASTLDLVTSMRPAQLTPENSRRCRSR